MARKKANRSECSGNLQIREALWGTIHSIDTSSGESINADWRFHTFPSEIQDAVPCRKGADKVTVDDFDRCVIRQTIYDLLVAKKTLLLCKVALLFIEFIKRKKNNKKQTKHEIKPNI